MEIKILELNADSVKILFVGESHTYMNALNQEILTDPHVDVSSYNPKFDFTDPELFVSTKDGVDPISVIIDAARRISADCAELLDAIEHSEIK
ncbi:DNA-directed RNA polymerase subunit L [Methanogenium sp. MK-MG]|uniref:DNA-directed RNA polymerase subunit L n=1 Tax=Methanogenium sp. MK-MG TaxID=2599926 RepID=UPI0013EC74DF|nr:DNA-directed RNA polymerase subunit L [Methanogenium sp. MK-MG]KAF1074952.1 DNA-directed RNA polymerase subunit L [Methanogenium sp. MK-MG]